MRFSFMIFQSYNTQWLYATRANKFHIKFLQSNFAGEQNDVRASQLFTDEMKMMFRRRDETEAHILFQNREQHKTCNKC